MSRLQLSSPRQLYAELDEYWIVERKALGSSGARSIKPLLPRPKMTKTEGLLGHCNKWIWCWCDSSASKYSLHHRLLLVRFDWAMGNALTDTEDTPPPRAIPFPLSAFLYDDHSLTHFSLWPYRWWTHFFHDTTASSVTQRSHTASRQLPPQPLFPKPPTVPFSGVTWWMRCKLLSW